MNFKCMWAALFTGAIISTVPEAEPIDIGSRLELLVDDQLIDSMRGVQFRMHRPTPKEIVVKHDAPWEGSGSGYHTIFQDGPLYRMYYKAWNLQAEEGKLAMPHDTFGAYAESRDGIHWVKPNLGLFAYQGDTNNNIVWMGNGAHDFSPFKDENPSCDAEARYKAVGHGLNPPGLYAFTSPNGIHWSPVQEEPIQTNGAFDTQNVAFWDTLHGEYRAYIRTFDEGVRTICLTTSKDFRTWSQPRKLDYGDAPVQALYTNQIKPYYRAPHIYIGFPARYVERSWSPIMEQLPSPEHRRLRASSMDRYGTALTDTLLMTSRDGLHFKRWDEAFLRPGLRQKHNWAYGDNYMAWHVVETASEIEDAPRELSLYATESYWTDDASWLRRFTLRIDGFVSMNAPFSGGEFTTKPFIFEGSALELNFATSAVGSIRVEVQDADGTPVQGATLNDAPEIFGDALDSVVPWSESFDLGAHVGTPIRLRFVLKDADLYAFRFKD